MSSSLESNDKSKNQDEKVGLIEFFSIVFWIIKTFWEITPIHLFLNISTSIINQIYSLVNAFILGVIIDQVIKSVQLGEVDTNIYFAITLILLLVRFSHSIVSWVQSYSSNLIRIQSDNILNRNLYIHIQK